MRRQHDFYESAKWQVRALVAHQPLSGRILEPCVGDHSIANELRILCPDAEIVTNDLDVNRKADYHEDARMSRLYQAVGAVDWVVTNPPFLMPHCTEIVEQAIRRARLGVCFVLRISFREPTDTNHPRGPFLAAHPLNRVLTMPRYSYTGNGKSDSTTTEWGIWLTDSGRSVSFDQARYERHKLAAIVSCYGADWDDPPEPYKSVKLLAESRGSL